MHSPIWLYNLALALSIVVGKLTGGTLGMIMTHTNYRGEETTLYRTHRPSLVLHPVTGANGAAQAICASM